MALSAEASNPSVFWFFNSEKCWPCLIENGIMSQLINFENFNDVNEAGFISNLENSATMEKFSSSGSEERIKLTLQILVYNYPHKINFTLKEAADLLNVGNEFIRRRIKKNQIKTIYFGDKPMVHIGELARILSEGL